MKKFKYIFLLSIVGIVLSNSCNEEEYDFNSIYPIIHDVTGTAIPMQGRHYIFSATIRGGSTYEWDSELGAEIIALADITNQWKVNVYFPTAITTADDPEIIKVVETTQGGVESDTATFEIDSITPFTALPINGSLMVNAGFVSAYYASPSANDKVYSSYLWESDAGVITPDASESWKMDIEFANEDVGEVELSLIEETTHGLIDTSYLTVTVLEYCALDNGPADLVGTWSGTDGFEDYASHPPYPSQVVTSSPTASEVSVYGLNFGWIEDVWGEAVIDGGTVDMIINVDGTIEIEYQYLFTTDYEGDPYDYWIVGTGRWNNCGTYPTLVIDYTLTNVTDGYDLPYDYYGYYGVSELDIFTARLLMDGGGAGKAAPMKASSPVTIPSSVKEFKSSIK